MKLLRKTTSLYLGATAVILCMAGIALFFILQEIVQDEMDEQLELQAELLAEQVRTGDVPSLPMATITELSTDVPPATITGDTLLYDRVQKKKEDYRYLSTIRTITGKKYRLTVVTAHIGWDQYYLIIFTVFLAAVLSLTMAGTAINFVSSRRIWRPFFHNLKALKEYSVTSSEPMDLMDSDIDEFRELKRSLDQLTQRGRREYMALREFTENASHELQTPLAIIRSKIDRLSQYPVSEEMAEIISQARADVSRLSRINRNLLLLARLDNRAFEFTDALDIADITHDHLQRMQDLFAVRDIPVTMESSPLTVKGNRYLFDVLMTNILSNAWKYTNDGGDVAIAITGSALTMSNSGAPLDLPEHELFDRFRKGTMHHGSTGLGLAIAREICEVHGWTIRYDYIHGRHHFSIDLHPD